ncbi:hypothetical protein BDN72DRAFT_845572 [Pluteus cervinus]|uniref:Uncharacterized protein n=1 Tax=Pluteus cervinus TaxID=181527 RepID=A0ACD3AHQ1_9AGAR|nr:hypothetical protein BDN72DRAFT_845572 [Pluteus cervinus]
MSKGYKSKGSKKNQQLARQAPHIGAWMLRTNATLKRWIEPVLYYDMKLGHHGPQDISDCKRYHAFCCRPPSFFTEHVKILSFGTSTDQSYILPLLTTCTGVNSLELRRRFPPFLFRSIDEQQVFFDAYWNAISSPNLRPTKLVIDLHGHIYCFPELKPTHPLFSNVTHLELEWFPPGPFTDENLLSLTKVIRFKVDLSESSTAARDLKNFLPAAEATAKYCPPNARICLIWCNKLPLEQFVPLAPISQISMGALGNKVVLGTRLLDKDGDLLEHPGYQCILANWCLERRGREDIWQQAEMIVARRRLNSEVRVATGPNLGS